MENTINLTELKEMDIVQIRTGLFATVVEIFSSLYWNIKRWLHFDYEINGIWIYSDALDRKYILIDPRDR